MKECFRFLFYVVPRNTLSSIEGINKSLSSSVESHLSLIKYV